MEQHNIEVASDFMKLNNLISLSIEALIISFYDCFILRCHCQSVKLQNQEQVCQHNDVGVILSK